MKKQPNSQMCFVCGMENPIGLKLAFYETGDGRVIAPYTPCEDHQGYPGVVHGGIISALLDEVAGRACIVTGRWVFTARMKIRYRRPIPLGQPLLAVGEVVDARRRRMVARSEVRLAGGEVGAEAEGLFLEVPVEEMGDVTEALAYWRVFPDAGGPPAIDLAAWGIQPRRTENAQGET